MGVTGMNMLNYRRIMCGIDGVDCVYPDADCDTCTVVVRMKQATFQAAMLKENIEKGFSQKKV